MNEVSNSTHDSYSTTLLGFWVYLMTDCILFTTLFATYVVLHNNTYGGPSGRELFDLRFALTETFLLLVSSCTSGLAPLSLDKKALKKTFFWFGITFLFGAAFLVLELSEFTRFVEGGNGWTRSAFLSAFFTLVGTHGLHISIGLLWMIVLLVPVWKNGMTLLSCKRLHCFKLFWHFLDVVWIFIFTVVYLMGAF